MVHRLHTNQNSFHWQSDLSDKRKDQLIAWVKDLSDDDASMLHDLLTDVREAAEGQAAEDAAGIDF